MNIFRSAKEHFFCFDESATGAGGASPGVEGGSPGAAPASTSTPAAAPASTTPPGEAGGTDSSPPQGFEASDPFAGFNDDLDELDLGTGTDPGQDQTPPTPTPAQVPAPAATAPAATPPAQGQVPAPAAAPAGNEPGSAPRSPLEEALDGFKTNSKALADWSGANLFTLSDEEAEALTTDAVSVIPKLMGRVQIEAMKASLNLIRNFVPQIIASQMEQTQGRQTKAKEALSEFYSTNTHLNEKDHGKTVQKWAAAFRAANPKASRADAIAYVGRAVSFEHNLVPGATPASQAAPFAPARQGGRQPTTSQQVDDAYAGLDQDFD